MKNENRKKWQENRKLPKWFPVVLFVAILSTIGGTVAIIEGSVNAAWEADRKVKAERRCVLEERAKLNEEFQRGQLKRWAKDE